MPVGVKRIGTRMIPEYDNRFTKYQWIFYSNTRVTREDKAMVSIENVNFVRKGVQRYLSWHKILEQCNEQVFLKTSQYSLENTCLGVFFNKMQALSPATLLKRDSNTGVFLCIFKNTYFEVHL